MSDGYMNKKLGNRVQQKNQNMNKKGNAMNIHYIAELRILVNHKHEKAEFSS